VRGNVGRNALRCLRTESRRRPTDTASVATYSYDDAETLAAFADAGGTTKYTYNARNAGDRNHLSDGKAVTFAYDGVGNLVTTSYPRRRDANRRHSNRNGVQSMQWDSSSGQFHVRRCGHLLSEARSNGTSTAYGTTATNRSLDQPQEGFDPLRQHGLQPQRRGHIVTESATLAVGSA